MTDTAAAIVDVQHIDKRFEVAGSTTVALQGIDLRIGNRRVRLPHRSIRAAARARSCGSSPT